MKYTIEGFSQEYALTLRKKVEKRNKIVDIWVDCTDLVILRWFVDFYPKMKKYIFDGKEYAWLDHNKLLKDLPIVNISKDAFISRMKKLVEFNILEYKFLKEKGSYSVYSFGENYYNLISNNVGVCSNTYGVGVQTGTGVGVENNTKDNNIIDKSIKDIRHIVSYLNEKTNSNYKPTTLKTQTLIKARLNEGFTIEDFKKVIDNKVLCWKGTEWEKYLRPETLFGTKFESYLNEKVFKDKKGFMEHEYNKDDLNNLYNNLDEVEI